MAPRLTVGVNLSPRQLDDAGLPARVRQLLAAHALAPEQLVLEITEGALVHDLDTAVGPVTELRTAGVSVAVDDVGTGYASLRLLAAGRTFPVHASAGVRRGEDVAPAHRRTGVIPVPRPAVPAPTAPG